MHMPHVPDICIQINKSWLYRIRRQWAVQKQTDKIVISNVIILHKQYINFAKYRTITSS